MKKTKKLTFKELKEAGIAGGAPASVEKSNSGKADPGKSSGVETQAEWTSSSKIDILPGLSLSADRGAASGPAKK